MSGEVHKFAAGHDGARNLSVSFGDGRPRVLVTPASGDEIAQWEADTLATDIALGISGLRDLVEAAGARAEASRLAAQRERAQRRDMADRLMRACGHRVGHATGDFYARPAEDGAVWLLGNLEKGWSAYGLRFDSWEALASSRPELRPVGCASDATGHYIILREVALDGATLRAEPETP